MEPVLLDVSIVDALGRTFVHSLWIGLIAAMCAGAVIMTTPRSSARLRYNLLGSILVLFLFAVIAALVTELGNAGPASPAYATGVQLIEETAHTKDQGNGILALFLGFIDKYAVFLFQVWAVFFLFKLYRLLAGMSAASRLRKTHVFPVDDHWQARLEYLRTELGIRRTVRLLQSARISIPVAIGWLKPVILVPAGFLSNLSPAQVEAILLHELAHIRRNDYLINILQHIMECVFFFNPAVSWISSLLRQEREACCDDLAVRSDEQQAYVQALVAFQDLQFRTLPVAMAFSSRKQFLLNRVKRLLTKRNKSLDLVEKLGLLAGLVIFCAFTITHTPGKNRHVAHPSPDMQKALPTGTGSTHSSIRVLTDTVPGKPLRKVTPARRNKPVVREQKLNNIYEGKGREARPVERNTKPSAMEERPLSPAHEKTMEIRHSKKDSMHVIEKRAEKKVILHERKTKIINFEQVEMKARHQEEKQELKKSLLFNDKKKLLTGKKSRLFTPRPDRGSKILSSRTSVAEKIKARKPADKDQPAKAPAKTISGKIVEAQHHPLPAN